MLEFTLSGKEITGCLKQTDKTWYVSYTITLDIMWKQTGIEARDHCQEVAAGVLMRNGKVKKCSIVNNTNHCGNASPR